MTNVLQGSRLCLYRDCGLAFRLAPWRAATRDVREFVWGRPGQVPMVRAGVFDVFAKVPGYASCMYYDSYESEHARRDEPRDPRGGRGGSALVRGPSSRRAAVESSSRTRPCSAWKTLRVRRYDLPPLRTGRAPLDARIALRAHLIPDGSHTTSSQRPKFTPRFSCPLSVRASSSA